MKSRIILSFVCLLIVSHAWATGIVKLHGKIVNPISDSISVVYPEKWVGYETKRITAGLAADGTFSLSFPLPHDYTIVKLQHGNQGTEIAPAAGDDLTIALDAGNFDSSLHYTGIGADIANFMAAHMLERSFTSMLSSRMQGAAGLDPDSFRIRINTSLEKEQAFMDKNGASLPTAFKTAWMTNYRYGIFNGMLDYPAFHEMQKQKSFSVSKFDVADFGTVLDVPAAFDDALLNLFYYRWYLSKYYYERLDAIDRQKGLTPHNYDSAALSLSVANMPPRSAELLEASVIYRLLKTESYANLMSMLNAFRKRCPNSEYLKLLTDKIAYRKKMSAGSPAMDFAITTIDGKSMNLSDLKGKVVFLDFWATWCGGCMAEMPHAREVEEHFKGKDVVFLYVSLDGNDPTWKKGLEKIQVDGLHMRDGVGGYNGPVVKKYDVNSVPAFFLIDKEGRFAMDDAPHPSETKDLVAAIDRLLNRAD